MAGNTRGKLKEQFEGVHRNFEWALKHLEGALLLVKEAHPKLTGSIEALQKGIKILDKLALDIYAKI